MGEFSEVISQFGASAKAKLSNKAVTGAPEDQLRSPLETLVLALADLTGQRKNTVKLVGETTLAHLSTRPDYAVTVRNALTGYIEVKAPGKGYDPRRFNDDHDKKQWQKLKTLPNLIYTDGNGFTLWQDGELKESVALDGGIEDAGPKLAAPATLLALFTNFLAWNPIPPRSAKQLAAVSARLCRLLREEVAEELERGNPGLTSLATEWRNLLFPEASNKQFADGYAQAVTFGLLVARVRKIDLSGGLDHAAIELRRASGLIGTALGLLVHDETKDALKTSLETLTRVLNVVDWEQVSKGDADAWLYFYEDFLEVYDNDLRKQTGSYYTPPQVVDAMVRLVDEALRDKSLFNKREGLADKSVTICDPAVGTGTYLLGVLRQIAKRIEADKGGGAVAAEVEKAARRMFGFEMQFGPFAVAQLRLIAEMQALTDYLLPATPNLYVTDTLGDPYAAESQFSITVAPIAASRKEANRVKREQPITVVIGNPPYKNKAADMGGWIEDGSAGRQAPMARWAPPPEWGLSAHTHHLKNLYVYFWRWASLKVFGSGLEEATGLKDGKNNGIICFITVSGFLNGPAFQKMREDLRRDCSAIWVIDCSPEGFQPIISSRLFQGVQQPVCIVLAARTANKDRTKPAELKYMALPEGHREHVKFTALSALSIKSGEWREGTNEWRSPFLPEHDAAWAKLVPLIDQFDWSVPGVTASRTWPIAPDEESLVSRWQKLRDEREPTQKEELFHSDRDRTLLRTVTVKLGSHELRDISLNDDQGTIVAPIRYSFRTLDRQWIIPDHRLISMARPKLWGGYSSTQVYLTALDAHSPTNGPSASFCSYLPDKHHYKGSFSGKAFPLWRNAEATVSNIKASLIAHLALRIGRTITPEDMMAYIAGVMAHPAFTSRFQKDLVRPGLRLPITAEADLFERAAALGREVIWLHTYGERFVDDTAGRPAGAPRIAKNGPTIPREGAIPATPEDFPNELRYDAPSQRLFVGKGYVENVTQAMVDYDVSGMNVLKQWFSYRKKDRRRPIIGDRRPPSPLSDIQPDHWLPEYTSDLLDLLHVLGRLVALEPAQAQVLDDILAATLVSHDELVDAGALSGTLTADPPEEN